MEPHLTADGAFVERHLVQGTGPVPGNLRVSVHCGRRLDTRPLGNSLRSEPVRRGEFLLYSHLKQVGGEGSGLIDGKSIHPEGLVR